MAKKETETIFFTDKEDPGSFSLSNQFAEHLEFTLVKDKNTATGAGCLSCSFTCCTRQNG